MRWQEIRKNVSVHDRLFLFLHRGITVEIKIREKIIMTRFFLKIELK